MTTTSRTSHTAAVIASELSKDGLSEKVVFQAQSDRGEATFEAAGFDDRATRPGSDLYHICVSTAAGCTRSCQFCATAHAPLGFQRLLTSQEITDQVDYFVNRIGKANRRFVIGFMGNGEPPDNPQVLQAILALTESASRYPIHKILVSTIGENLNGLRRLTSHCTGRRPPIVFYLSLHSVFEEIRRSFIPGRKSLDEIMHVLDSYSAIQDLQVNPFPNRLNVALMRNVELGLDNASVDHARAVAKFATAPNRITGQPERRMVKISTFNPIPYAPFEPVSGEQQQSFLDVLDDAGVPYYLFAGDERNINQIEGTGGFACGQLRATTSSMVLKAEREVGN